MFELTHSLEKILQILSHTTEIQFFHTREICELILNQNSLHFDLCSRLYPFLTDCLLKCPIECVQLFFQEQNMKV